MKKLILFCWCILYLNFGNTLYAQTKATTSQASLSIVPQPLNLKQLPGRFTISASTKIYVDAGNAELKRTGEMLAKQLKDLSGLTIGVANKPARTENNAIILTTKNAPDSLGDEGYMLSVRPNRIVISGKKPQGVFYGFQTVRQLLPAQTEIKNGVSIPAVDITDKPRFGWRGMMLDVGRYFYSVDFIKKYLDDMAIYKLNTFHWHLTEDHGWRIEIKKYPELTRISAWRDGTQYDKSPKQIDPTPNGGYYTQDQIREIVAYAKERYITVVPEIEMPGHSLSALVAYPQLSCTGGPFKMPVQWGIQKDIYCAGNEETFKFLENVLSEVVDLFPGQYIHIGGDEAPKDRWKACSKCQERIKKEGLKDEHELQSYFIRRIENFLLTKNKRIIGWDEILEGGLAPNAAVMSWRGISGGIAAAKQHHDVVMNAKQYTYFDYYQGEPYLEPVAIGNFLPLEKVYSFEPVPAELSAEEARYIKGTQGNIWSEYIHSPEKVEYMAFPRAAALAEVAWTQPRLKNWEDFKRRMESQYQHYKDWEINYSKSAYNVYQTASIDSTSREASTTFKTDSYKPEIRYTLDGSEPSPQSLKYQKTFKVKLPATIKAATFKNGIRQGKVSVRSVFINTSN